MVILLECSSCALVVRKKMPNSSRITFYSKFKMSPLISNGRFVAEPDGGTGLVDAAQSQRKTLPL